MSPAALVRLLLAREAQLDVFVRLVSRPPIVTKPADDIEVRTNTVAPSSDMSTIGDDGIFASVPSDLGKLGTCDTVTKP